jgi:hypothetical protein
MATKFIPVWQELGADHWPESQTKMMVPLAKPRLMLLESAKNHSWKTGPNVEVAAISKDEALHALNSYLANVSLAKTDREGLLGALQSRIAQSLSSGGQLLSVTGKVPGWSWITAGKESLKLIVAKAMDFDIAFKFLRRLDDQGNMVDATAKRPSNVDGWIYQLHWILGSQANIWFVSTDRRPFNVNKQFGPRVNEAMIRQNQEFADEIDRTADVTVFLVGNYVGENAAGQTFADLTDKGQIAVVIDDKCTSIPVVKGDDPFIVTLAHELVHVVLDKRGNTEKDQHLYNETNILFCKKVESTLVSASLLEKLYPSTK